MLYFLCLCCCCCLHCLMLYQIGVLLFSLSIKSSLGNFLKFITCEMYLKSNFYVHFLSLYFFLSVLLLIYLANYRKALFWLIYFPQNNKTTHKKNKSFYFISTFQQTMYETFIFLSCRSLPLNTLVPNCIASEALISLSIRRAKVILHLLFNGLENCIMKIIKH